ncbi:hypothetical protein QRD43_19890 [Pelomonas sp. APW6]|uniref:Uncharacterized protein n=1 Tax=Roseateles subflavus TaxID=3053353 RepID=A0ABT7LMS9_9BURK|nr:hypothetical protein [Pelomonas sp. APW6]MDL5034172.1 hypothetical protein [Pelomonas sp. APW6]
MKRILLSVCLAALLPALASAQTVNPNAKVDPKNNKVSRPVVEKPKQKLMTRDELRACFKQQADNDAEAKGVLAAEAEYKQARERLMADKETLTKEGEAIDANAVAIKAEQAELIKSNEDLKTKLPDMSRSEQKAAIDAYNERAKANDAKIETHNKRKDEYIARARAFDESIEKFNKSGKDLESRSLDHLDAVDNWKKACGNKPYDEADEIAIKKEQAAAAGK